MARSTKSFTYRTLRESADELGVTEKTVRRYIAEGRLPAYRLGPRELRVKVADLDALLVPVPTGGAA